MAEPSGRRDREALLSGLDADRHELSESLDPRGSSARPTDHEVADHVPALDLPRAPHAGQVQSDSMGSTTNREP